jgi:hypothetical protein
MLELGLVVVGREEQRERREEIRRRRSKMFVDCLG